MMWEAIGAIVLFTIGLTGLGAALWHDGHKRGYEAHRLELAERRSLRRMEARTASYHPRHQAAPWPGPDPDTIATTGELRALAETGDIEEITRLNAAWMRVFDLIGHARKQEREQVA